jgi:uncharacterized repeat protein (TIGR03809 family)
MSKRVQPGPFDSLSHRWHALAERRRAHFVEMYDSGRWKHYYTEEQFVIEMREAIKAAEGWERIAKRAPHAIAADAMVNTVAQAAAKASDAPMDGAIGRPSTFRG